MLKHIEIEDDSYTDVTRDPDSEYDGDDTSTSHHITGFRVKKDYGDLEVAFTPERGKDYFLVYAIYSTGDSFSHHDGKICFIGFFEDKKLADENKKRIEENYKNPGDWNSDNHYSVTLIANSGKEWKMSKPWQGYFERLDWVEVQAVQML